MPIEFTCTYKSTNNTSIGMSDITWFDLFIVLTVLVMCLSLKKVKKGMREKVMKLFKAFYYLRLESDKT